MTPAAPATMMAVPRSGCQTMSAQVPPTANTIGPIHWLASSRRSLRRARTEARNTITASFENSETWTVRSPNSSHRLAPPLLTPTIRVTSRPAKERPIAYGAIFRYQL